MDVSSREVVADKRDLYYPAFDYLRITLAVVVASSHAGILTWKPAGDFSVQIFFALSGWLVGGILLRSSPSELPRFYYNRSARIWIPYFLAIFILIAVSLFFREPVTAKWIEFIVYKFTFVYNFFGPPQLAHFVNAMPLKGTGNHFWSICAEEQFYLVAPLLITALPMGRSPLFWLALFAGLLFSRFGGYFSSIALGVFAAASIQWTGNWHQRPVTIMCLLTFAISIFGLMFFDMISYAVAAPAVAVSIVMALAQPGLQSRLAGFLGGISYPMYLNHWLGVFIANYLFAVTGIMDRMAWRILSVLFALIIASFLYLIVDVNVRRYRNGFFTPARGRSLAAIGYGLLAAGFVFGISR